MKTIRAKVHMLPTKDKTGAIWINRKTNSLYPDVLNVVKDKLYFGQHLYFTTDEEIKEGDWALPKYGQPQTRKPFLVGKTPEDCNGIYDPKTNILWDNKTTAKIIATTDPKLTTKEVIKVGDRVHSNKQDFNDQIVATESSAKLYNKSDHYFKSLVRIPQSFIEEYCKADGIDEVDVEYKITHKPKDGISKKEWNDAVDVARATHCPNTLLVVDEFKPKLDNNCIIIHPVEEKMYSKEEVVHICKTIAVKSSVKGFISSTDLDKWIEENL